MSLRVDSWLRWLTTLPPDLGRRAIPADSRRRETAAQLMAQMDLPHQELYPWGLEAGHRLWQPWDEARQSVEAYADGPQEAGAQADWIIHDREAATVTLASLAPLPSQCARFSARACPRMAPMGHESEHADCNYWAWPGMAAAAPGLELYPEWQRFDCHKYYPLFQLHLCGTALAQALKAELCIEVWGSAGIEERLATYAGFSHAPQAFHAKRLPDA